MKSKVFLLAVVLLGLVACDDTTEDIGASVLPEIDKVETTNATYQVISRSVMADSVLANTSNAYLGAIIDPETHAMTQCSYMAQFNIQEDFRFPDKQLMNCDENGRPIIDSCEIRIFMSQYYGDSLSTMKMRIRELDRNKIMEEGSNYYTDFKPQDYLGENPAVDKTIAYAICDLGDNTTQATSTSYRNIRVKLPVEYGRYIVEKYYENPQYFENAYQFIHNVCPGFYFETVGGVGALVCSPVTTLSIYFRYYENINAERNLVAGYQRMAATEEVIQNTVIDNDIPLSLVNPDNDYTMIKSPAGIYTEVELPVSDIVAGEHYNDTINNATLVFRRYNSESYSLYSLEPPTTLVMLKKAEMYNFFEEGKLPDNINSFYADFSNNAYSFTNIARLIQNMKQTRDNGAGVLPTDTESKRNAKYQAWESANPDWNKVVLMPVKAEYTTVTAYYQTNKVLTRMRNELGLSSVKIEGGLTNAPTMTVVYSNFNNK